MKKNKRTIHLNVFEIVIAILLGIYSAVMIFMFVWALYNSFKTSLNFDIDCVGFPRKFTFDNYVNALQGIRMQANINGTDYYIYFFEMLFNSVVYSVGCAFFATLTPCLVAYVTAKYKVKFNKVVYGIVIFVMVTPIVGNLPSQVAMAKDLGIYDSQFGLWFMSATFLGIYYLMFYSIFKGLSWEYAEAAFIDGAGHWQILLRIMLPLIKNTFLVIFLLNFIARWNDYQTPWIFLPNTPTAAVGVQFFSVGGEIGMGGVPIKLAASILLMLPVIVLFLIFRKKLVGNLTLGGIKG